jgi:hypothetical protein
MIELKKKNPIFISVLVATDFEEQQVVGSTCMDSNKDVEEQHLQYA